MEIDDNEDQQVISSNNFTTSISTVMLNHAQKIHQSLCKNATQYAITHNQIDNNTYNPFSYIISNCYTSCQFYGIMLDTGAATSSTAGYGQVQAYIRTYHTGTINTTVERYHTPLRRAYVIITEEMTGGTKEL